MGDRGRGGGEKGGGDGINNSVKLSNLDEKRMQKKKKIPNCSN